LHVRPFRRRDWILWLQQLQRGEVLSWHFLGLQQLCLRDFRARLRLEELHELPYRDLFLRRRERVHELRRGHLQEHHWWHPMCQLRRRQVRINYRRCGLQRLRCGDVLGGRREHVHSLRS